MYLRRILFPALFVALAAVSTQGQAQPAQPPAQGGGLQNTNQPQVPAQALAQNSGSVKVSLEDAVQMALQHNHSLLAARTTIQQNEAEEITANLRPNPVLLGDAQYLSPSHPTTDYLSNASE